MKCHLFIAKLPRVKQKRALSVKRKTLFAVAICMFVSPLSAEAARRAFVTDQLEIPVRSGQSEGHRIIKQLPSGAAVTLLDTNETSGYSLVRAEDGEQGYVLSRLLTDDMPVREVNQKLTADLAALRQASAGVVLLQAERDRLKQTVGELEHSLAAVKAEKEALTGDTRREWFLIGASVLFVGALLGWLLPKLGGRRKRDSWGSSL